MTQSNAAASSADPVVSGAASRTGAAASAVAGSGIGVEFASAYCPRCSARLTARSCKLICSGCGYYMSCSDFL